MTGSGAELDRLFQALDWHNVVRRWTPQILPLTPSVTAPNITEQAISDTKWVLHVSIYSTMSESSQHNSPAPSSSQSSAVILTKRKPIPRKGHTKSRAGCVVCKRRRVKCDEALPQCGQCRRLEMECEYLKRKKPASLPESTSLTRPLRTTPAVFDVDDMRFFRHFLFEAYPPLPIDGSAVWQQISQLTHEVSPHQFVAEDSKLTPNQYDFLLHAFLAIGASHLNLLSSGNYEKAALKHRVLAMKSLNEHLSKTNMTVSDAEAAFGATLALTFQSAYMPDGLMDFLTMVRGCAFHLLTCRILRSMGFQVSSLGHARSKTSTLPHLGPLLEIHICVKFRNSLIRKLRPSFLTQLLLKNSAPIPAALRTCARALQRLNTLRICRKLQF